MHVVPIYPCWHPAQSRRRLASVNVPTPPQPVVRKSAFFSQDIKWMNLGYFALTGHQTIERAMESRTPTRPVPLALFSRYKQLAFSCRTTRKTAENLWPSPPDCRNQVENRISSWKEAISDDADLRPSSRTHLANGCGSKLNRGHHTWHKQG